MNDQDSELSGSSVSKTTKGSPFIESEKFAEFEKVSSQTIAWVSMLIR